MHILEEILICKHFLRVWNLALALWTYRAISVMSFRGQVAQNVPLLNSKSAETCFSPHSPLCSYARHNVKHQQTANRTIWCSLCRSKFCLRSLHLWQCEMPFGMFRTTMGRIHNTRAGWAKAAIPHLHFERRARGLRALWLQRKSACCFHNC